MNLDALQQAEFELDQIFEDESVSGEVVEEARKVYNQLEESKKYYHWL